MPTQLCVRCERPGVAEVDIDSGVRVGMCAEHLAEWQQKRAAAQGAASEEQAER
jgi:hypothetical protein